MTGFNQLNVAPAADAEATRILYQGLYGVDRLSEVDKHRFTHLMNGFFNIFRNLYHQYLDGTFPETQWQTWALEARQLMKTPGVEYFRKRTQSYEDLFQYLEELPDDSQQPLSLSP